MALRRSRTGTGQGMGGRGDDPEALHRRLGVGEAPGHEDRARWARPVLQRGLAGARNPQRTFRQDTETDFPLARRYFEPSAFAEFVTVECGKKLKHRRTLPSAPRDI